ncbi:MAG: hypothetical protein H0V17_18485 [Deltaproteobacteria bacterium]|nr:hypothetical protein [Deltaproteobacteria bacterium]
MAVSVLMFGCLDATPAEPPASPAKPLIKAPLPPLEVEQPGPNSPPPDLVFGDGLEVRAPVRDHRLSLLPILTVERPSETSYLTLAAGLASGEVIASDNGVIEWVTISNRSRQPVAILGGELLVEGMQDRIIRHDLVIAPGRTHTVSVVCAEAGRMAGGTRFRHAGSVAEPTLRTLARGGDQFDVWDRIGALNGTPDAWGGSYRLAARAQHTPPQRERLDQLISALDSVDKREERGRVVGFAVAIDDRVVAVERFATPGLYRDVRAMVIASYLPSSLGKAKGPERAVTAADVRAFARANAGVRRSRPNPPAAAKPEIPALL